MPIPQLKPSEGGYNRITQKSKYVTLTVRGREHRRLVSVICFMKAREVGYLGSWEQKDCGQKDSKGVSKKSMKVPRDKESSLKLCSAMRTQGHLMTVPVKYKLSCPCSHAFHPHCDQGGMRGEEKLTPLMTKGRQVACNWSLILGRELGRSLIFEWRWKW